MPTQRSMAAIAAVLVLTLLGGCATQPYDYTAFKKSRPRSILILPPVNDSPAVDASHTVLSTLSYPLGEAGYYVLPVALAAETFRQNGLSNPAEVAGISIAKLRQIFGADAALYTRVKAYGTVYKLFASESVVTVEGRLVDLRSGIELWKGSASASSAEGRSNSGGGLAGLLISAVVHQVMESSMDQSRKVAPITSARLLFAGGSHGLPYGPRSAKYEGADAAIVAGPAPAPANASLTSAAPAAAPVASVITTTAVESSAPPVVAPDTTAVVAMAAAPALPESTSGCQQLVAPGIGCRIGSGATGSSVLHVQARDRATVTAQGASINALVKVYCAEANRSGLGGVFELEEESKSVQTVYNCSGGSWSPWKPLARSS